MSEPWSPPPSRRPSHLLLRAAVAMALVVSAYVVVPVVLPSVEPSASAQPVSGAVALGGGLDGSIDARTGQFSISTPLTSIDGTGDADLSLTLGWNQAQAGLALDRYGFGGGWGLGLTFVQVAGVLTVFPAQGGSYTVDPAFASGLHGYTTADLTYRRAAGTVQGIAYQFTLSYDDGRVDHFDSDGNLVARTDRFGNLTRLSWTSAGPNRWHLGSVTSSDGLTTSFTYGASTITVAAPKRSDGVVATTVVGLGPGKQVANVTDPGGSRANFFYTQVSGTPGTYLNGVLGPSGARTSVGYRTIDFASAPSLLVAQTLDVTDPQGKAIGLQRRFDINPRQNTNQHTYAGYPNHVSTTKDALADSGDPTYRYTTSLSNGRTSTISTYDSAHRLVGRTITAVSAAATPITVQQQDYAFRYAPQPGPQPATYSLPTSTTITYRSSSGPLGFRTSAAPRTVTTSTLYDDAGRLVDSTDALGTKTHTTYDARYGMVTSIATTGADGTRRLVTNTLTPDGDNVRSTTEQVAKAKGSLSARSTTSFEYTATGDQRSRTTAWAPGAEPADDAGPSSSTTTSVTTVDATAATKTVAVTLAAGTDAATTTTTVFDLATGKAIKVLDALGRATTTTYDAGGRGGSTTAPSGLTSTTTFTPATPQSAATSLEVGPDGHQTLTTFDALGRISTVTDNVADGGFTDDPRRRTVSTQAWTSDGATITATDLAGRTTTIVSDALGREISREDAGGVSVTTNRDEGANTVKAQTVPDGSTSASKVVSTRYDDLDRQVSARTLYPFNRAGRAFFVLDPLEATTFDGLGRPTTVTAGDLSSTPDYAGPGGTPISTVIAPTATARVQSPPLTTTDATVLDGSPSLRTMEQDGSSRPGTKITIDAAGRVRTSTDGLGRTSSFTYTADGQQRTRTSPSGTVTTSTYDPTSGRLSSVSSRSASGATTTTTYAYVPGGQPGAGKIKTLTNESGTLTYAYDADGNTVSVAYPDGATVSSDYDDRGLLQTSTDITGAVTTYTYNDGDASLRSAVQVRGGVTLGQVSYTYDGLSRVKTTTRGNGLVTTNGYTPDGVLASQVTVDGSGKQVESHSYAYDGHNNVVRKTDTTAVPSACPVVCVPSPSTFGTWTTTYAYDAYDRLTASAVYPGTTSTGRPRTSVGYVLDVSGNPVRTTRTTTPTAGGSADTEVVQDTVDAAGQLTRRSTGAGTTTQAFDDDGRLTTSLSGAVTSYRPDGMPASVTLDGATTTFSYWADGTRRSAVTTGPGAADGTTTFHYGTTGTLINDTTLGAGSATASYLLTTGREARTLQPATTGAGRPVRTRAATAAPLTTGAGTGYYLRDRHSSVTAMVDSAGSVTGTYAYGDYGTPTLLDGRDGTLVGAADVAGAGRSNPLRYAGASLRAMWTDLNLGTFMTPARFYDPQQGRFTVADTANVHNRYVGFGANPIVNLDPSGQNPVWDCIIDAFFTIALVVASVASGGAFLAAVPEAEAALFGATAITTEGAAQVALAVSQGAATVANLTGVASNFAKTVDDANVLRTKKHLLNDDERATVGNVATVAGTVASVAGLVASGAEGVIETAQAAAKANAVPPQAGQGVPNAAGAPLNGQAPPPPQLAPGAAANGGGQPVVVQNGNAVGQAVVAPAVPVVQRVPVVAPLPAAPYNGVPPPLDVPPPPANVNVNIQVPPPGGQLVNQGVPPPNPQIGAAQVPPPPAQLPAIAGQAPAPGGQPVGNQNFNPNALVQVDLNNLNVPAAV